MTSVGRNVAAATKASVFTSLDKNSSSRRELKFTELVTSANSDIRKIKDGYSHRSIARDLSSRSRGVDSVGLGDRRGCDECKELLESEQWLAL
jgi:hypothetical protein